MSKTSKLLLETTIQLFRVIGSLEDKASINDELRDKELYTTSFVFREFLRTIISDVEYAHHAAASIAPDADVQVSFANLSRFFGSGQGNYSKRSKDRLHYVMAEIQDGFGQTKVSRQHLLTRLERIGQQWMRDFFEVFSTEDGQTTAINCLHGLDDKDDEVERLRQGKPFPLMPSFPVGAARFLDQHKELVQKAEVAMQAAKARQKDHSLLKVLERLKSENGEYDFLGKLKPTTKGNWCLGDLLITLETPHPPEGAVYTNDRHFDILCPALGRIRYQGFMPRRSDSPSE